MTEKQKRGMAVIDPALQREIASKGGKAAHAAGTAHQFTEEEARAAGRKGGLAAAAKRKARKEAEEAAKAAQVTGRPTCGHQACERASNSIGGNKCLLSRAP